MTKAEKIIFGNKLGQELLREIKIVEEMKMKEQFLERPTAWHDLKITNLKDDLAKVIRQTAILESMLEAEGTV